MSMQNRIHSLLAVACVALTLASVGCSSPLVVDRTLTMHSGEEIWVRNWVRCDGLKPDLQVATPPAHGTVQFRPATVELDQTSAECRNDKMDGIGEFYISQPGFTGQDTLTVTEWWGANFRFPSHDTARIVVVPVDATPWPEGQAAMRPAPTTSTTAAELPADVLITPPDPAVPEPLARLSGTWTGSMCPGWAASVKIAIEQVTPTGGKVTYAAANSSSKVASTNSRFDVAAKPGDELRGKFGSAEIVLRGRSDGLADIFWRHGEDWCSGVLERFPN